MKTLETPALVFALFVLSSCAPSQTLVINDPIGPSRPAVNRRKVEGYLIVHSAREVADLVDSYHPTHSSYTIYSENGRVLRRVRNLSGSFYRDPEPVPLPAGTYKVSARVVNYGWAILPVIVENGKTTIVYLDGEGSPAAGETGDWIRLPNGEIIGSRATEVPETRQSR